MSVQAWARQPPGAPGHRALARVVEQRAALRAIALDQSWAKGVHPERFRKLAREGARFTAQHLQALSPLRRRATLVATALDTITRLTDDTTTRPGSPHRPGCTNAPPPLASKRTTSRPCTPTSISISAGSAMRSCVRISRASSRPAISSDLPRVSPPHSGQD